MNAATRINGAPPSCGTPPQGDCPLHDARNLTGNGVRAVITLDGQTYFLRITRAGKLILTK